MKSEDFYSGEPVISGSPPMFSSNNQINMNDTNEAANMASFGMYAYDSNYRASMNTINTGAGYNSEYNPQYNGYYNGMQMQQYMNQPVNGNYGYYPQQPMYGYQAQQPYGYSAGGIGTPPTSPISPFGNPLPSYNYYQQPNQYYNNYNMGYGYNGYQQQPQQVNNIVHVSGIGNEFIPPADFERRISDLEMSYYRAKIDQEAEQEVNYQVNRNVYGMSYNAGPNYYGYSYYGRNQYTQADIDLQKQVEALKEEARQNAQQFYFNLSRLAHNFCKDNITDDQIKERYNGKDVEIPSYYVQQHPEDWWGVQRFYNMVPFDNSQMYRDHFLKVRAEFNAVIPEDSNLKDTFMNMGILDAQYKMEEEMHRRKNGKLLYQDDNGYKRYVRKKARERYAKNHGIVLNEDQDLPNNIPVAFDPMKAKQDFINSSSVLKDCATLKPDGTLEVSFKLPVNAGSHAGEVYDTKEQAYDEKRARFGQFMDTIPGNIYLDKIKQEKLERYSYE